MSRPFIALSGRRKHGRQIVDFPASLSQVDLDLYFSGYARAIYEAGGLPVHLPFDADPADYVGRFDAIVIPGGADVDPALWGAAPETDQFPPEPERDRLELGLLDLAAAEDLPVLGICRGHQLLNVHAGGSLHQDVPPHGRFDIAPNTTVHEVRFVDDSRLGHLYGPAMQVNSLHHQAIDHLGSGFVVTGHSDDGTIEAIESVDGRCVGVQWHPEMMDGRSTDPIFTWLVETARR